MENGHPVFLRFRREKLGWQAQFNGESQSELESSAWSGEERRRQETGNRCALQHIVSDWFGGRYVGMQLAGPTP